VLLIAEDFQGWECGVNWGDMAFLETHGDRIDKIAIVAEPQWETGLLMFAGARVRLLSVKFLTVGQATQAQAWLG
jgi:hypothetical protein